MKWVLRILAVLLLLLFLAGVGAFFLVRSDWFSRQIRSAAERELSKATGGKAEIGEFRFDWRTLTARAGRITVPNPGGGPPLVKVESATVRLKLVSLIDRKVNVASIDLQGVDADIRTDTLPRRTQGAPLDRLIDLAAEQYRIRESTFRIESRRIPVEAEGKDLSIVLDRSGSDAYKGKITAAEASFRGPIAVPRVTGLSAEVQLERNRVVISRFELRPGSSRLSGTGEIPALDQPSFKGRIDGTLSLAEWDQRLSGTAQAGAAVTVDAAGRWKAEGKFAAQGLTLRHSGLTITGASAAGPFRATPDHLESDQLEVSASGGHFRGTASVTRSGAFAVRGNIEGFSSIELAKLREMELPWGALVSGAVEASPARMQADLALEPLPGSPPARGNLSVSYDLERRALLVSSSVIELPKTRVTAEGTLDEVRFGVFSRDLDELLPGLTLISKEAPSALPLKLDPRGVARIDGVWSGGVERPLVTGTAHIEQATSQGERFESLKARFELTPSSARFQQAEVRQDGVTAAGDLSVALNAWRLTDESALSGSFATTGVPTGTVLKRLKLSYPVAGVAAANVRVAGTVSQPAASGTVSVAKVVVGEEPFDSVEASFVYQGGAIRVDNGKLREGRGLMTFSGEAGASGAVKFEAAGDGFLLSQWKAVQERRVPLDGRLSWRMSGTAQRDPNQTRLTSLNGDLRVMQAAVSGRPIGDARVLARTKESLAVVEVNAQVRESKLYASGEWSLGGNSYGLGQLQLTHLTFADLQELGFLGDPDQPLAFTGFLDAEVGFSGPILRPETWTGVAKITTLEVQPNPRAAGRAERRLVLRNREPIVASVNADGVRLQDANLVAEGTEIQAGGSVAFRSRNPFNLQVKGRLNLPVVSMFEPDLVATGVSTVDAAVRGSLNRPQVTGRMEIRDAAFNLRGLPNGLERTNGVIIFDRTRANIEKLTAQTGGGDLSVGGFVGFGTGELIYGLTAAAQRVRVRYPAAVSTTFNANLTVSGTGQRSHLAGTVVINKMGIVPRTDIGTLLAEASRAANAPAAAPNDFLRGMQVDVSIQTAADAELQSSLARDLRPDAKFRLYGSAVKPVLIGRASLNQGQINFFGNQYSIARGDISFYNTAKIEPVLDFDMETRVRGVTVNINFTGPVSRLDVSYRSDPPLRSSDIVALLAVGRSPDSGITPGVPSAAQHQSFLQSTNNTLLGQAISAPISGRLERLFGVSRIKIDPELTGVTNTPQARLTVEQQLSRDLTVTYITNLNRTQQQVVRVQWDFSRDFSVLAVRDDNGVFGVDFFYRKRF